MDSEDLLGTRKNAEVSADLLKESFIRSFEECRRRVRARTRAEPDLWLAEAYATASRQLGVLAEGDLAEHLKFRAKWASSDFIVSVAHSRFLDERRWERKEQRRSADWEVHERLDPLLPGQDGRPMTPDQVPAALQRLRQTAALRTALRALVERGAVNPRPPTALSGMDVRRTIEVFAGQPTVEDSTALSDEELKHLIVEEHRRARERWAHGRRRRAEGARDDPRAGHYARAAAALGVHPATVSRSVAKVVRSLITVRYVAGVLAPKGALLDLERVTRHLDILDDTSVDGTEALGLIRHQILTAASRAVQTTEQTGTRVDPDVLFENTLDWDSDVAELHAAESVFSHHTDTQEPNCVLCCQAHNPTVRNRVTEY